jgi:hypothetical protein
LQRGVFPLPPHKKGKPKELRPPPFMWKVVGGISCLRVMQCYLIGDFCKAWLRHFHGTLDFFLFIF